MIKDILLIILFLFFILFSIFYILERKKNQKLNNELDIAAENRYKQILKEREDFEREQKKRINNELRQARDELSFVYEEKIKRQTEIDLELDKHRAKRKKEIEENLKETQQYLEEKTQREFDDFIQQKQKDLAIYCENIDKEAEKYRQKSQEELDKIQTELKEYYEKRKAINEDILRNREVQQQIDFYRVCLNEEDKSDIEFLSGVAKKIHHPDAINKLIWDVYIKRAVDILVKNVLNNESVCGIYKFTNIDSGEVYIGKSTDVKKRAYEHYKYAFGLSGIASSQFHYALMKCGVDRFTFELLEKCDKDKLTEREKYYIDFYETKTYGYNQRLG